MPTADVNKEDTTGNPRAFFWEWRSMEAYEQRAVLAFKEFSRTLERGMITTPRNTAV